jgi:serine/threonine protein kinase
LADKYLTHIDVYFFSFLSFFLFILLSNSNSEFGSPLFTTGGYQGSLPTELGLLTSLTALIVTGNRVFGAIPDLSNLRSLSICQLSSSVSFNTFCCPVPPNLPQPCLTDMGTSTSRETHTLTCSPLVDCSGRLKIAGSIDTRFAPFVGSWRGDMQTRLAIITPAPRSDASQYMPFCTSAPYVRKIVADISSSFESVLTLVSDGQVPVENNFVINAHPSVSTYNAKLVYYEAVDSVSGWLRPSFANRSEVHAHCVWVKFESADVMLWWINHDSSQRDDCFPLQTTFVPTATCEQYSTGSLTAVEMATRRREMDTATSFIRFERTSASAGPTVAPLPPSGAAGTGTSTTGTAGNGDDSTNIAIIAGSVAGGVVVLLCVVGVIAVYLITKRRNEGGVNHNNSLVVDGNPLYNATATPASQLRSSHHTNNNDTAMRQSNWSPSTNGPQTPAGSGADMPTTFSTTRISRGDTQSLFANVIIDVNEVERGKRVGEGAFGIVYRGRWRGRDVAIKEAINTQQETLGYNYANLNSTELEKFKMEARRMQSVRPHQNIVPFYGVITVPVFCIVCEFCDGGSLDGVLYKDKTRDIPMLRRWNWIRGIANGALHLHREGLVHRDLAARNVLLTRDNDTPMLTDFGMAREGAGVDQTGSTKCFDALDHQLLTSDGFLFLDQLLARVEWRAVASGGVHVLDWRGLRVASFDVKSKQLVFNEPRALGVNIGTQSFVELTSADVSIVATGNHELYVRRAGASDEFAKLSADGVLESGAEAVSVLAHAAGGARRGCEDDQPPAFHELCGFWLGAGARAGSSGVQFVAASAADEAFLCERFALLGVRAERRASSTSTGGAHYVVRDAAWSARVAEHCAQLTGGRDALRHVVRGVSHVAGVRVAGTRRSAAVVATTNVEFRDRIEVLLLRAGYSVSTTLTATPSPVWHVSYADDVEPVLRLRKTDIDNSAVVARRFEKRGVSWCCDMSSSDDANDGFVVVRRAERVAAVDLTRLAASGDATSLVAATRAAVDARLSAAQPVLVGADASEWIVVRASRPTIQGNSRVGPVKWMAPEQLTELKYSRFSDVWSFACVCYEVMARRIPYEEDEIAGAIFKIMSRQWLQMPATTPPALLSLVTRCWQWDANARPTMEQVIAALNAATDPATGEPMGRQSAHSSPMRVSGTSFGGTGDLGEHLQFKCDQCANAYQHQVDLDYHRVKRHS